MKKIFLVLSAIIGTMCAVHAQNNVIGTAGNVLVGSTTDNGTDAVLQVTGTTSITTNLNVGGQFNGFKFGTTSGSSYYIGNQNALPTSTSYQNVAIGSTGNSLTSGFANFLAGASWVGGAVTTGSGNTAIAGYGALASTTTGSYNTALGNQALFDNQTGDHNTALGSYAGTNVTGSYNTMIGGYAGIGITGSRNTILGSSWPNASGITTGNYNTIIGPAIGLASDLSSNIILADGLGHQRININSDGYVGIGTSTPSGLLQVGGSGSTSSAQGIYFGGADVDLYRSEANMLKTDMNFNAAGSVAIGAAANHGNNQLYLNGSNLGPSTAVTLDTGPGGYSRIDFADNNNSKYLFGYNQSGSDTKFGFYDYNTATWTTTWYNGNVGIGTTTPLQKFESTGAILNSGLTGSNNGVAHTSFTDGIYSAPHSATPAEGVGIWSDNQGNASVGALYDNTASSLNLVVRGSSTANGLVAMKILGNGNIAIGAADPKSYKLAVAGKAVAESMTVQLQGAWSDYVFKPDYNLMPLTDVKAYVDKNQHLPEIPSAAEVAKDGQNLGEMNKLLLKKVEELTLYLVEKEKQVNDLNTKVKAQDDRLNALEKQMVELIKN